MPEVSVVDNLESNRLQWQHHWLTTPRASFFQSFDWAQYVWDLAETSAHSQFVPKIISVRSNGESQGFLPLVEMQDAKTPNRRRILTTFPTTQSGLFQTVGRQRTAITLGMLRYLANRQESWHELKLQGVDSKRGDLDRLATALTVTQLKSKSRNLTSHDIVDLQKRNASAETEQKKAPRSNAIESSNLVRFSRTRRAELQYQHFRCMDRMDDFAAENLTIFQALSELTGNSCFESAIDERVTSLVDRTQLVGDFHLMACRAAVADIHLLSDHQGAVAFVYNCYNDSRVEPVFWSRRVDQEPAVLSHLVGARMLEKCRQSGDEFYDCGTLPCRLDNWPTTPSSRCDIGVSAKSKKLSRSLWQGVCAIARR